MVSFIVAQDSIYFVDRSAAVARGLRRITYVIGFSTAAIRQTVNRYVDRLIDKTSVGLLLRF